MASSYDEMLQGFRGQVSFDEPLSRHTSLKVGGPADCLAVPADRADLDRLLTQLGMCRTPFLLIGGGYNLLCRDGGIRGVVISLAHLAGIESLPGDRVQAEAGVTNQRLTRFLLDEGLTGLEFLCGIPGTVGGALAMNAGAQGGAIFDRLESLTTWHAGAFVTRGRAEVPHGYRFCGLAPDEVIVSAVLAMAPGKPESMAALVDEYTARRATSQRVGYPNAGSFFKNPPGGQAWRLIEEAGLRGKRIGGAKVSEVHSNFLVNTGGALARDFLELAALIKEYVLNKTGILLEEEVRIVGEDKRDDA